MKRTNVFYLTRHKRVKDLTKQLQTIQVEHQRKKLKQLLTEKKTKRKQLTPHKEIIQPPYHHLKKGYGDFSFVESIASKQPFLNEKQRMKLQQSDRAYSSSPNMKSGSTAKLFKSVSEVQDLKILNRKFLQYDRTIDTQNPLRKIQALKKLKQGLYAFPKKSKGQMKKTFFQKMVADKFNFYQTNQYSSIKSTILYRSRTDQQIKSKLQSISKIHVNSTLNPESRQKQYQTLESGSKSRIKSSKLLEFQSFKSRADSKSRIKSQASQFLVPITIRKNLDSYDN